MSLCCEWFVPGQHPAAPLDHIARHYSPDVKNLVMYLCGKPPSGKSIDEVVSIVGLRILNEFDAMQKWVLPPPTPAIAGVGLVPLPRRRLHGDADPPAATTTCSNRNSAAKWRMDGWSGS